MGIFVSIQSASPHYWLESAEKYLDLEISPLGNPAMPMKIPYGLQWLQNMDMNIPNVLMSNVTGFEKMASGLMKKTMSNKGVASIEELRELGLEADVSLFI